MRKLLTYTVLLIVIAGTVSVAGNTTTGPNPTPWTEGVHYKRMNGSDLARSRPEKIEVVEYFWYGCPHCYALDPYLTVWIRQQPSIVSFRRVPAGWSTPERIAHSRLYFVLYDVGRLDLHQTVFDTIHKSGNRLFVLGNEEATLRLQRQFAAAHGISSQQFDRAYPQAIQQAERANAEALQNHVPGVPSITVDGRYITDIGLAQGTMTGIDDQRGSQNLIALVQFLVQKALADRYPNTASR